MNISNGQRFILYIMAAVTGGLIGKVIADKIFEKEDLADYEEKVETYSGYDEVQAQKDMRADSETNNQKENIVAFKEPKKKAMPAPYIDYSSPARMARVKAAIKEVARETLGEEALPEPEDPTDLTKPCIISLEAFANYMPDHAKVVLTYYANDDTLVDENETVVKNPEKLIGDLALVSFGQLSGDVDSVYVRHIPDLTDYEIVRMHTSYTEAVLGIIPKPEKKSARKPRPNVRKVKNLNDEQEDE